MINVLTPGLQTTVQDSGRFGYGDLGIPRSGAQAEALARFANRLAGNGEDAALLEISLEGPELVLEQNTWVASTGLPHLRVDGRPLPGWSGGWLAAGSRLDCGTSEGAYGYVAFHGGVSVPLVLGSRSTYPVGGFGGFLGRALQRGDVLAIGDGGPCLYLVEERLTMTPPLIPQSPIRFVPDPRFASDLLARFLATAYTVSPQKNRMGARLTGEPLAPLAPAGGVSQAMPTGAIQVPPDGQPIVLLNDHGTVGGYPILGTVVTRDRWRLAGLRPGTPVRFSAVSVAEAQDEAAPSPPLLWLHHRSSGVARPVPHRFLIRAPRHGWFRLPKEPRSARLDIGTPLGSVGGHAVTTDRACRILACYPSQGIVEAGAPLFLAESLPDA